eukprot:m.1436715 g.1436715  ORF g.1436715 m.1436715 type:complete len:1067 (+) comp25084_c0_seq3:163-3363(+)
MFNFLSGAGDDASSQPTAAETVEGMCSRLQISSLPEDRRTAICGLRAMAKQFKVEVGTRGMDPVLNALREDHSDNDTTKAAIEMFYTIMAPATQLAGAKGPASDDMGVMFTEIFTKDTENVALLLAILEEPDFQIKYNTIKLLTLLVSNAPKRMQESFLSTSQGLSCVMDHLNSSIDEVIRNEVLLLMIELTKSDVQIQKIVAFESAFEKIFDIIELEGQSEGMIIVEDCLRLAQNLLRKNESNQTYFREIGCVQRIVPFMNIRTGEGSMWPQQKVTNIQQMLSLIRLLVSPVDNSAKRIAETQASLQKNGLIDILCKLCLSGSVPSDIFQPVAMTTADAIRGFRESQVVLATLLTGQAPVVLMQIAYDAGKSFVDRCAALYLFQCTLYKNQDMQLKIAATFLPGGDQTAPGPSAGQVLCQGLLTGDPLCTWFSALAFSHVLIGNRDAKEKTLRVAIQQQQGTSPVSLLSVCVDNLMGLRGKTDAASERKRVSFLILLITWLSDCPYAISIFLDIRDVVGYLVSQMTDVATGAANDDNDHDAMVPGLAAVLLSTCIAYNDDTHEKLSREAVLDVVKLRGEGVDDLLGTLQKFISADFFATAIKTHKFVSREPTACWFDHEMADLFRDIAVSMKSGAAHRPPANDPLASPASPSAGHPAASTHHSTSIDHHKTTIDAYKDLIGQQDAEISQLKQQVAALQQGSAPGADGACTHDHHDHGDAETRAALAETQAQLETLQRNHEALALNKTQLETRLREAEGRAPANADAVQEAVRVALESAHAEHVEVVQGLRATIDGLQRQAAAASTQQSAGGDSDGRVGELETQLQAAHADLGELHEQIHAQTEQLGALTAALQSVGVSVGGATGARDVIAMACNELTKLHASASAADNGVETADAAGAQSLAQAHARVHELEHALTQQQQASQTNAHALEHSRAQVAELQRQLEQAGANTQALSDATAQAAQLQQQLVDMERQHMAVLEQERAEHARKVAELQLQPSAEAADVAVLKQQVADSKAVMAEHDDLLICLGEQEETMKKYRARLVALGETVTDDEESGDEDDDEADES